MNKSNRKDSFLYRHRILMISLLLFFVLLPLIFIPSAYISTYMKSKPILFGDKHNKISNYEKQTLFDIEFKLPEIILPNESMENGLYKGKLKINVNSPVNEISNIQATLQLSVRWANYTTNSEASSINPNQEHGIDIPFNYNMDKHILPFVKPGGPDLYIKITYTETILSSPMAREVFFKISYDNNQTKITPQ